MPSTQASAQGITIDGRLSPAQTLTGPNYAIGAGLGRQVGGNLFHSFGIFGLNQGESATFSGPAGVSNVIGRVTGGTPSSINGAVNSAIPGANVYLINPAGVVFGPNASVNVSGSFQASSADYLRMKDGARFQATNPDSSTLSGAPPEAFGFLSANPRPVTANGATLQLAPGHTLGLVGGDVTISGGVLYAPTGTVHVASAAGPGELPVDPRAGPAPTVAHSGRVQVRNADIIADAAPGDAGGGSVLIHAGDLTVSDSDIEAENSGPGLGGVLSLHGDRSVVISDGSTVQSFATATGTGPRIQIGTAPGGTVTLDAATVRTTALAAGDGGAVAISTGALVLRNGALVLSETQGAGAGGPINLTADSVLLDGSATSLVSQTTGVPGTNANPVAAGAGGNINLTGAITIRNGASVQANTSSAGAGGSINVAAGSLLLDGSGSELYSQSSGVGPAGAGGNIVLSGGMLTVQNGAAIQTATLGSAAGGSIRAVLTGNATVATGGQIQSRSVATNGNHAGDAGPVTLAAQDVTISGGQITSNAPAAMQANAVTVNAQGDLMLDGRQPGAFAAITSTAAGEQSGGPLLVTGRTITLLGNSFIGANPPPSGVGGPVTVTAQGKLTLDGSSSGQTPTIATQVGAGATGSGNAGPVTVNATDIALLNGTISGPTADVEITAKGTLSLDQGSLVAAANPGTGSTSRIGITAEDLSVAGGSKIVGQAFSAGRAADILVNVPGAILINGTGSPMSSFILSISEGSGSAGNVTVNTGALTLLHGGFLASVALASGNAGQVALNVGGALTIDGAGVGGVVDSVSSEAPAGSSGSAGTVRINAGSISILNGAYISSSSDGTGTGGSVLVATPGALLLDSGDVVRGGGIVVEALDAQSGNAGTATINAGAVTVQGGAEISTSTAGTGRGGGVTINAGALTIARGGQITSLTRGSGDAGEIALTVGGAVTIDGGGGSATAVGSDALSGSSGAAGTIRVNAGSVSVLNGGALTSSTEGLGAGGSVTVNTGMLALSGGGLVASTTEGFGNAGGVALNVAGPLTIDGANPGGLASSVSSAAQPASAGSAGSVQVTAGSVSVRNGGLLTSSTSGTGAGGSVQVTTPGALVLDGTGTVVSASALGAQSGNAGTVTLSAGTIAVQNGARVSSATNGSGRGGDVSVAAGSTIQLSGAGSQVNATSTGAANAGSITVSAPQVTLRNGAAISTEAQAGNGGNITVAASDLLFLQRSSINTSVDGALGNGGDIAVGARFAILQGSVIQANAVGGNGGNVQIDADQLVQSFDSAITASSQRGVSGDIFIAAEPLNLNGSLVVLASDLHAATALLREGCAARGAGPRSSLLTAGRGGERQGLEATLPALYFVGRPVRSGSLARAAQTVPAHVSVSLSSQCR